MKILLDSKTTISQLREQVHKFVDDRDWSKYHNPKNLTMSIAIEAAELMEKFQFFSNEESIEIAKKHKQEVAHELVDVLAYIVSFANVVDIDIISTFKEKVALNIKKYPLEKTQKGFGRHVKITSKKDQE